MSAPISDETDFRHKNSVNRLRQIPTGVCTTPTKQSKPIYSNIRYLCSENDNSTYVTDTNEKAVNTGSISSHKYSSDDLTELDRLIEFHANASQRDSFDFDSSVIHLASSILSETFSNISWLDPKCLSEKLASEEVVKDCSKRGAESHRVKHISGVSIANDQIRVNIHETPKRNNLKPFERGKKQKPLRLANLPRKIYTRGKNEVRIMKEDIKIVETDYGNEMFDIKKHLARARRKLTFPLEDSFKTSSSSFTSIKPQKDSHKHSLISTTSSKSRDDFDEKSSRPLTSSMRQGDSDKVSSISITSTKLRDNFAEKSSRSFTSIIPKADSDKISSISVTSTKPRDDFYEKSSRFFTSRMPQEDSDKKSSTSVTSTQIQYPHKNTTGFIASRKKREDFNVKSLLHKVSDMEKRTVPKENGYFIQKEKSLKELGGNFLLEDYLSKLKGVAAKPSKTKRAKEFEKRTTSRTYFDFDDYCMQIFNLKEKFIDKQNKNKTV